MIRKRRSQFVGEAEGTHGFNAAIVNPVEWQQGVPRRESARMAGGTGKITFFQVKRLANFGVETGGPIVKVPGKRDCFVK